jgi:hypothetical protein
MTLLNSQFDVISHDPHPNAQAGLMVLLDVQDPPGPYSSLPASGTPRPGTFFPGAIVAMNDQGNAVLADGAAVTAPAFLYITVDGNQDYDGAFVHKLTCIQGGGEFTLDVNNFVADSYAPGMMLTCANGDDAGKFRLAVGGEPIYGIVGNRGADASKGTLHVLIPQGISVAAP